MSEIIDCMVFVVQKTCWSMWQFVKFIGLRMADLFGLTFNILACVTIIRLPCMMRQFAEMDSMAEWRIIGFLQCLIFLMDIPVILIGLISIALTFGFILIPLCRKIREKNVKCDYTYKMGDIYFGGFKLRTIVIGYFFRLMCDIFCLPLGLICLLSWRCVIFIHKIEKKKEDGWEGLGWRKVCIIQFLQLVLDIPCILVGVIVMLSWRSPFLICKAKKLKMEDHKWDRYRFESFRQFAFLFADAIFIMMFAITMVTWRSYLMIYELCHPEEDVEDMNEWSYKFIIAKQASMIFVDIPCILCAIVVFLTLWRIPNFLRHCRKDEWELRKNCIKQFALLMVDFALLLLNIICFLCAIIVMATLWRAYPMIRDLRKYCRQRAAIGRDKKTEEIEEGAAVETAETPTEIDGEEEQLPREPQAAPSDKKKAKKQKARITWKIRMSIFKHFAFLFIDIPAIAVSTFILVTVFRFPKLLSKLVQAGNFYMEFALIVFTQLVKLFVDIVFLMLFIILLIMRPIQSWVHLLEDEDHRKNRVLHFYLQWMPDILNKRHQMYREMEEIFSSCLKERKLVRDVRARLTIVNAEYIGDLQWVRDKVKKYELDEEYGHLISMVQFYEGKRAYKMARLYHCELNYLRRPDVACHNANLIKFRNEMLRYEVQVNAAIRGIEDFEVPKVPLWSKECGLRTRTREETQRVLIKCLPSGRFLTTLLVIINLLLIYRGPALIINLYRRSYDRKKIVFACLREYLRDFFTLILILVVVLTLYRAPFLLIEIANDIISKRSWKAVRETVKRYPPQIADDLVELIFTLLSWETVRFLFTALLFGILMPAHLFLTVMKFLCGKGCCSAFTTGILYVIFIGFPFVLSFKLAKTLIAKGYSVAVSSSIGAFGIFLMFFLILAAVLTFRNRENTFSVRPKVYDYVRFNWTNTHVLIFEVVEFLQLLAIVFVISEIPMYGAATLNNASQYLLLNFASFEIKFWLTTVLFILWFFICGLPVILEQVLESFTEGTFAKQVSWTLLVSLFTNTLFVTMIESMLSFVACSYKHKCPGNIISVVTNATNASSNHCAASVLIDDTSMECWEGNHRGIAVFGLLALVWYSTTAIIFGTRYGDSDHPSQDLKFSPIYNVFINFAKALMVGVVVLASANAYVVFGFLILANVAALLFTLLFRRIVGFSLSNSFVLVLWRVVTFVCGALASLSAIIAIATNEPDSVVPLGIFLGGTALVLVVATVVSVVRVVRRVFTPTEHRRKEFRTGLLQLESRLIHGNHMVNSWTKRRNQWKRLVAHVYEAQKNDNEIDSRHPRFDFPEDMPLSRYYHEYIPPLAPTGDNTTGPPPLAGESIAYPGLPPCGVAENFDDLPPPPPYQELFPHIMGPYGAIPPPPYPTEDLPTVSYPSSTLPKQPLSGEGLGEPSSEEAATGTWEPKEEQSSGNAEGHPVGIEEGASTSRGTNQKSESEAVGNEAERFLGSNEERDVEDEPPSSLSEGFRGVIPPPPYSTEDLPTVSYANSTLPKQPPSGEGLGESSEEEAVTGTGEPKEEQSSGKAEGPPVGFKEHASTSRGTNRKSDSEGSNEEGDVEDEPQSFLSAGFREDDRQPGEQPYDSILFLESSLDAPSKRAHQSDPILVMECNGKNLLSVLEEHIHYSAFSYAFLAQLPVWKSSVEKADWSRLLECLRTLETSLDGNFNLPTHIDMECADLNVPLLRLGPDPDREEPPVFVPEPRDPEVIRAQSDAERSRCLQDIAGIEQYGAKWADILERFLPTKPVFRKWIWDSSSQVFEIHLRRAVRGTVTQIAPRGLKLAKGASLRIPKILKGRFPTRADLFFEKGCEPKGSKGPIGATVSEVAILEIGPKTYLSVQGKLVSFDKAMDSLYVVEWK